MQKPIEELTKFSGDLAKLSPDARDFHIDGVLAGDIDGVTAGDGYLTVSSAGLYNDTKTTASISGEYRELFRSICLYYLEQPGVMGISVSRAVYLDFVGVSCKGLPPDENLVDLARSFPGEDYRATVCTSLTSQNLKIVISRRGQLYLQLFLRYNENYKLISICFINFNSSHTKADRRTDKVLGRSGEAFPGRPRLSYRWRRRRRRSFDDDICRALQRH
jgi:hypothetical protein